jgi:uncharacterized BrkB/YihY/UPF0761 family membrane protein
MNPLYNLFFDPGRNMWTYVARMFAVLMVGAILLGMLASAIWPTTMEALQAEMEAEAPDALSPLGIVINVLLIPAVVAVLIWLLSFLTDRMTPNGPAKASGLFAAAGAGMTFAIWGAPVALSTAWYFFCLAASFHVGRQTSVVYALAVPFLLGAIVRALDMLVWAVA